MKRTLSFLLVLALVLSTVTSAFAADDMQGGEQPQESENQTTVTVRTLEELEKAISAAEYGDTITLNDTIIVSGVALQTDKQITLVRSEEHAQTSKHMIHLKNGASLNGFSFLDSGFGHRTVHVAESEDQSISIENCVFSAAKDFSAEAYIHCAKGNSLFVSNCTFKTGNGYSIYGQSDTTIYIDSCNFVEGYYFSWFLIHADGNATIQNCNFAERTGYITTSSSGVLTIADCDFNTNIANERVYPNIYIGGAERSGGTLNITDTAVDGVGLYDLFTGEKIGLPLRDCTNETILAYMSDEYAEQYFRREGVTDRFPFSYDERNEEPEEEPAPDDEQDGGETPIEPPTTPSEPPQDDNGDDTHDDQQPPSEPQEQPNDDDNADIPEDGEQDEADDNDNEPVIIYRPVYIRVPVYIEPEEPAPVEPSFVCGDAVIDVSRSVVLEGYDDGLLHLEDGLTRAQLAKILCGLLDEDTLDRYETTDTAFADVAPEAWYCPYVNTIANAGIVCGTGNGNFDPDALLTWGHIVTILSRFVEPQEYTLQNIQYDGWAADSIETAVALGWIADHAAFNPDAPISRGELAYFINYVLSLYR